MAGYNAGEAFLQIIPSFRGVQARIDREAASWGASSGRAFADQFNQAVRDQTNRANLGPGREQSARAGASAADAFTRAFQTRVEAAARAFGPRVRIDANTDPAIAELENLRRRILETQAHLRIGRIDDATALAQIDEIQARLALLGAQHPNVRVKFNAATASAELAALKKQIEGVGNSSDTAAPKVDKLGKSGDNGGRGLRGIYKVLLILSPALLVFAGAALAGIAGLGALAGASVLAVLGIRDAIKTASPVGSAYATILAGLNTQFKVLKQTAAGGALLGFQQSVGAIRRDIPLVTSEVGVLSRIAGDTLSKLVGGITGGLRNFGPLLNTVANAVDHAAGRFESWATGPGGSKFAGTLGSTFAQVGPVVSKLGESLSRVLQAVLPIGTSMVSVFGLLSDVLNHIPVGGLKALAVAVVTLLSVRTVVRLFQSLSGALTGLGTRLTAMNSTVLAGAPALQGLGSKVAGAAGAVGILAGTLASLPSAFKAGQGIGDQINGYTGVFKAATDGAAKYKTTFTEALEQSGGAIDDNVRSAAALVAEQSNLTQTAAKYGITADQVTTAITGTTAQADAFFTLLKSSGTSDQTVAGFHKIYDEFQAGKVAAAQYAAAVQAAIDNGSYAQLNTTADSYANIGKQLGITAAQAQKYGEVVGITADQVKNGSGLNATLRYSVDLVATAYRNASTATSEYVDALATFSTSDQGVGDRAALIAATLKQSNGDTLSYGSALANVAVAQQSFVNGIVSGAQEAQVGTKQYLASIVNLKTGVIDYNNAAAGPLIQNLQGIQDAALKSASAVYQHQVSLLGASASQAQLTAAADAAYKQYTTQTRGQFIDEAHSLGLTNDQALKFADTYFGLANAADIKKKVEAVGADPVLNVLTQIRDLLGELTGHPFTMHLNADTGLALNKYRELVATIQGQVAYVQVQARVVGGTVIAGGRQINAEGGYYSGGVRKYAAGGIESHHPQIVKTLRVFGEPETRGESYIPHANDARRPRAHQIMAKTAAVLGGVYHYAAGGIRTTVGADTFVLPKAKTSGSGAATTRTAAKRAAAQAKSEAALILRIDVADLDRFFAVLDKSATTVGAAGARLIQDAAKAGVSNAQINLLVAENRTLEGEAARRAAVVTKLTAANKALAAVQKLFADEVTKVRDAFTSSFDPGSIGASSTGAVSVESILREAAAQATQGAAFAANLARLRRLGLSSALLSKIADDGPASAGKNATALAGASAAQIAALNKDYALVASAGVETGKQAAQSLYGAGVSAAAGLVAGLKSQDAALRAQMKSLADAMVGQIKHDLGIHSPSRVGHELGSNFGASIAAGIGGHAGTVRAASAGVAAAAQVSLPSALPRLGVGAGIGGAGEVNLGGIAVYLDGREITGTVDRVVTGHFDNFTRELTLGRA